MLRIFLIFISSRNISTESKGVEIIACVMAKCQICLFCVCHSTGLSSSKFRKTMRRAGALAWHAGGCWLIDFCFDILLSELSGKQRKFLVINDRDVAAANKRVGFSSTLISRCVFCSRHMKNGIWRKTI